MQTNIIKQLGLTCRVGTICREIRKNMVGSDAIFNFFFFFPFFLLERLLESCALKVMRKTDSGRRTWRVCLAFLASSYAEIRI